MLAFKLQVFLYLWIYFLSFIVLILCNKFGKCIAAVLNDAINQLRKGVSAILQSCIGKHQLMAKRTFSMHYLSLFKATIMVAS